MYSGIFVYGTADEKAMAQITNCYTHPSTMFAALTADNHVGYGVPIGGVVFSKDHINASGVGYDIGCFVGSTKVALADGRILDFEELIREDAEGKPNYVFSVSGSGDIVVDKLLAPRQTRMTRELIRVTLDNGEAIESTPDHIYCLRDGSETRAESLVPGASLMPLYMRLYGEVPMEERDYKDKRFKLAEYQSVYNPRDGMYRLVHHLSDDYNMRTGADDKANGGIRHHVDFRKLNNSPDNIRRVGWKEHFKIHSDMARERAISGEIGFGRAHKLRPEFFSEMGSKNMTRLHSDPGFAARRDDRAMTNLEKMQAHSNTAQNWKNAGRRGAATLAAFNKSEAGRAQSRINGLKPRLCKACGVTFETQGAFMAHWHQTHKKNHKVVSVERITLDFEIPVYCLTAPECHNFALASGVFVHNCGNTAMRLSLRYSDVKDRIKSIMDDIVNTISFGVGQKNKMVAETSFFNDHGSVFRIGNPLIKDGLEQKAREQLGTVGSGNHYVDLFRDKRDDQLWVGVHFGSRGFGHTVATEAFKAAGLKNGDGADLAIFHEDSELGKAYIEAMIAAGAYAREGRHWVCRTVADIVGCGFNHIVNNHHNYAWRENHGGVDGWIVRKGATPLFPGQFGFIGSNMRDESVIVKGVKSPTSADGMCSAPHGAGRVLGRMAAIRQFNAGDFQEATKDIEIRGGGLDELPGAYKKLEDVLAAHDNLTVVSRLIPVGVAMAGKEFDPYKD